MDKVQIEIDTETRKKLAILECVKNIVISCPKLSRAELLLMKYNSTDHCPSWAVDQILQERNRANEIELDIQVRTQEQEEAQLRNECIMHIVIGEKDDATEKIVRYLLRKNHIYTLKDDDKAEMFIYESGIYVRNGESSLRQIMRRILDKGYKESIVSQILSKIQADTFIDYDKFMKPNNKYEIPVQNGILNVLTKTIEPFTPYKIFFNKCPVIYDPRASCPNIDKFLSEVLASPDDCKVYYELGGFALIDEYLFEKAGMFVGGGRNGKGKSLELMKRIVGSENCYGLPLASLDSNNPNIWQIHNKKLNLAGDISNNDLKDTGLFKSMTGRDQITVPRKYHPSFTFVNSAKFVFACNELPMVYDTSAGFWDRWILLEFPYFFQPQEEFDKLLNKEQPIPSNWKVRDESIIEKIATPIELSGLLNAFLEGLDRLLKQKHFSTTKGSSEIKNLWIRKANSFMAFCFDFVEESYEGKITKKELRSQYARYCNKYKLKGKSDMVIKISLQELFGATEERKYDSLTGNADWYWEGIKWKNQIK